MVDLLEICSGQPWPHIAILVYPWWNDYLGDAEPTRIPDKCFAIAAIGSLEHASLWTDFITSSSESIAGVYMIGSLVLCQRNAHPRQVRAVCRELIRHGDSSL
jgi:hypothetical protein